MELVHARRQKLTRLLREHRYLPVAELKDRLGVSEATLRRDLAALARENKLTRTYGGALSDFDATFDSFQERRGRSGAAKRRIAQAARQRIRPGMTCYFDSGTTLFALASALHRKPVSPLTIVTNNLPVAEALADRREIEIYLTGGQFFGRQRTLLGKEARRSLKAWKFDAAFLGAEAFSDQGIWNSTPDVVGFQQAVLAQAAAGYFLLDAAKLGHETRSLVTTWAGEHQLITNATRAALRQAGITLPAARVVNA